MAICPRRSRAWAISCCCVLPQEKKSLVCYFFPLHRPPFLIAYIVPSDLVESRSPSRQNAAGGCVRRQFILHRDGRRVRLNITLAGTQRWALPHGSVAGRAKVNINCQIVSPGARARDHHAQKENRWSCRLDKRN